MEIEKTTRSRGRPLSFDRDTALEKAMHVFWQRGYEAASISELTTAMGITAPSLYSAFGDKEHLFLTAIERYANGPAAGFPLALEEEPTAYAAIRRLLLEAAEEYTRANQPKGCMIAMAATNCTQASAHIQAALAKRREAGITGIRCRIECGIQKKELAAETDAARLANFYATVYRGMALQAADGASHETLVGVAEAAMQAWPGAVG
ncbi:TetR/AcrR family transcriptional regulator [Pelomonas sp. KK5]|uniref:TetR/AcrR family transcriptional regulator n=1 Tax=Pelomonas sp. KK5 TaxID=1855730 RepID=UPI00097C416D|nr:TetR/AcrR family transcriptional regulator [Pelomonas sp. KK5]